MSCKSYEKKHRLGSGTYSTIISVLNENKEFAMKIFSNTAENGVPCDMIREINSLKSINCPNVISLLDIDYDFFKFIIIPVFSCNLIQFLKKNTLQHSDIKFIFFKICKGIHSLHSNGILHRDIKPPNICLSSLEMKPDIEVVIIDLGYSKKLDTGYNSPIICSSWYRPPENLLGKKYSYEADVWSAGCILAEMYLNKYLFPYDTELLILMNQTYFTGVELNWKGINEKTKEGEVKHFIKYGEDVFSLVDNMLKFNPEERFSIAKCLNSSYFESLRKDNFIEAKEIYIDILKKWKSKLVYTEKSDISHNLRKEILFWVLEICFEYKLPISVYFRTTMILDYYLILNCNMKDINLLVTASLLIAGKSHTYQYLSVNDIELIVDDSYITSNEIKKTEKEIIKKLDFDFTFPDLSKYYEIFEKDKRVLKNMIKVTFEPEYLEYDFFTLMNLCDSSNPCYNSDEKVKKWLQNDYNLINKNIIS